MDAVTVEQAVQMTETDFSLWALFLRADPVVQLVIVGLIAASVWSWAIIFEKLMLFRRIAAEGDAFETLFWSGQPLQEIHQAAQNGEKHPLSRVFIIAMREWARDANGKGQPVAERVGRVLSSAIVREMGRLEKRLLFLATVGSVAPFVGLFGTVWGIMNSFQAIALSRNTDLSVVAPGIAEALFATGLGLLAAIPAVVAYNRFTDDLNRYGARLDLFADDFVALVARRTDGA